MCLKMAKPRGLVVPVPPFRGGARRRVTQTKVFGYDRKEEAKTKLLSVLQLNVERESFLLMKDYT